MTDYAPIHASLIEKLAADKAATRKDEGVVETKTQSYGLKNQSPTNYAGGPPERITSAPSDAVASTPDRQGESLIAEPPAPKVSEVSIAKIIDEAIERWEYEPDGIKLADYIGEAIHPYLRTTKPVLVSLEKCESAAETVNNCHMCGEYDMKRIAKAVLDAAQVKYE